MDIHNKKITKLLLDMQCLIGTILYYKPGILIGGKVTHDCNMSRLIGYYLEPLIMLAPFMTKPITITMKGITNGPTDPSVCVAFIASL